jgi:hypothetical protein
MLRPKDRWAADAICQCLRESQHPWILGKHITVRNSDPDDDRTSVEGPEGFTGSAIMDVLQKVLGDT